MAPRRWVYETRHRFVGLLGRIVRELMPYPCLGCGSSLDCPAPALGLCVTCRRTLRPPSGSGCRTCGRELPGSPGRRCGSCLATPPPWQDLRWAFSYEEPAASVVRALKFRRATFLASGLARAMSGIVPRDVRWDAVCHVPLPTPRRLVRGFDQAELLARRLAWEIGIPHLSLLRRAWRRPQSRLRSRRVRRRNLRRAFSPRATAPPRIVLVDDVVTTGATAREAARVLTDVGAERIAVIVAARTPESVGRQPSRWPAGAKPRGRGHRISG